MPHTRLRPTFPLTEERLAELNAIVPEALADGKINWDVLREILGEHLDDEGAQAEHFGLFWPGKRAARHLAVVPSRGTIVPVAGEGVREATTRNLFIEGDNLEVLKLLQKSYAGQVKMIYIDPPFNTGNDFVYMDDFADPLGDYLRKTGQSDERGKLLTTNSRADGRFHSNWLSMIYPRLRLARGLLREDGVIFISIDDNEVHNLRHIMNEVFGEEAFVACFVWHRRQIPDSRNESKVSTDHEYVLCYRKSVTPLRGLDRDPGLFSNPDDDPRGPWTSTDLTGLATKDQRPNLHYVIKDPSTGRKYSPPPERGWAISKERFEQFIAEGRILWPPKPTGRPRAKRFFNDNKNETTSLSSVLEDVAFTQDGTKEIQDLFGEKVMSFPKPSKLIKLFVQQASDPDSLLLDFFAGCAPTAQAVFELNREDGGARRLVLIQLPEPTPEDSVAARAGFATMAELGKERIRRVIKKMTKERAPEGKEDLGFRVMKLTESNFKRWHDYAGSDIDEVQTFFEQVETPLAEEWTPEGLLAEVMLLEGFPLDSTVEPFAGAQKSGVSVVTSEYSGHRLLFSFDKELQDKVLGEIEFAEGDVFVCLDSSLTDAQKIRLADRCNLKTI